MSDAIREAFEKWAENDYMLGYSNGKYGSRFTQCAWEAWQAARAQTLLEVIRDDSGCPAEVRVVEAMQEEAEPEGYVLVKKEQIELIRQSITMQSQAQSMLADHLKALLSAGKENDNE